MFEALPYLLAHGIWRAAGLGATRRFHRALRRPEEVQREVLRSLLRANEGCAYGRRFGFADLRGVREFQDRVPVVRYEELAADIDAVKRGRAGLLTSEPVVMLEKSGGSSGASKYIPYTARLKREFARAVAPWTADLLAHRPALRGAGAYWSVSPLAAELERTEGGLPVGFEEDTEYFGPVERRVLERLILTPPELARVADIETCRYVTLRFLLRTERLGFLSVWHPSFLSLLFDRLGEHAERLVDAVERGRLEAPGRLVPTLADGLERRLRPQPRRAAALRRLLRAGRWQPEAIWPHLSVVSCWTDAAAAQPAQRLQQQLAGVEIQGKGLLATEGVVSIPLLDHPGAALALTSHFLEFLDPDQQPRLAHELEAGTVYRVVLTTGGGLYRYALGDRVEVVGRVHETPLIRFLGKEEHVSDLAGEKLHEEWVRTVLDRAFAEAGVEPVFALLAPEAGDPPAYVLFTEARLSAELLQGIADRVEAGLCEGHHYAYCRRLGQLGTVEAVRVENGWEGYMHRCVRRGQRAGDVKPVALSRETGWRAWFGSAVGAGR